VAYDVRGATSRDVWLLTPMPAFQCPHCSKPLQGGEAFCPSCGGRLTLTATGQRMVGRAESPAVTSAAPAAVPAGKRPADPLRIISGAVGTLSSGGYLYQALSSGYTIDPMSLLIAGLILVGSLIVLVTGFGG